MVSRSVAWNAGLGRFFTGVKRLNDGISHYIRPLDGRLLVCHPMADPTVPEKILGGVMHVCTMLVAHYDHAAVMAQGQFLFTGFFYTALAMMVVATIAMLCSTIFKSAMVSTAAAMGSVIVGFIVVQMARHESWVNWLFPTHLNLMGNWSGDLSQQLEQHVGLASVVVVLLAWAIVSLVVSLVQFTRRDVLNA
jgi:hypothetical protein